MPNTNGAIITLVKATKTNGSISEETLPSNAAFEIVVEAEAGENVFGAEASYKLQVVLTDRTTNAIVAVNNIAGHFGDKVWVTAAQTLRFAIPAPGGKAEDHVYSSFAVLQAGRLDPIVDFEEGEIFVITHP